LSFFIVGPFERICLNNVRGNALLASPKPEHIVFRWPAVQSPIPGADLADADDVGADFRAISQIGNQIGAQLAQLMAVQGCPAPIMTVLKPSQAVSRACAAPGLVARIGAPC
jgi:hypothetical protein